jgi:hypothetical protein
LLAAERAGEKIAVEVKSFLNPSAVTDFYAALRQFLSYRLALKSVEPELSLYLAVPVDVYQTFFQYEFTQTAIQRYPGLDNYFGYQGRQNLASIITALLCPL